MDTVSFEKGMSLLDQRFRQGKHTPEPTAKLYYKRLKHVPSEAFLWACEQAIEDLRTYPTPGELLSLFYEWQRKHPEKIVRPQPTDCPDCFSTGYLWARKPVPDFEAVFGRYDQVTLFRCAKCENHQGIPASCKLATRSELEAQGYEIDDLTGIPHPDDQPRLHRLALASKITKPIPNPPSKEELERRKLDQLRRLAELDRRSLASGERDDEVPF